MIHPPRYRTLMTYGVFDGMSPSDTAMLRRLSAMGEELIVGCATDAFCMEIGVGCLLPFSQRRHLVECNRYVSRVIAQDCWDQVRTDIVNYNVSALAIAETPHAGLNDLQDIAQVLYLDADSAPMAPIQALAS